MPLLTNTSITGSDVFSDEQFGQLHKRLLAAMQAASVKCANADIEVIKTDIKNIADMMDENHERDGHTQQRFSEVG
ncbi:hypothetical protein PC9H_005694 [Pleurotus ostreatus]|uniref:Uncharacterized protein n=1 Tax=Pleurotus ostreatus TaxID=5322 RepID=A0A8H7A0E0_PLEOS|nr:uncharacterized protein PC9H_005694 [Pleurotus ostreatus]KAF7433729.1 hypothetical protein PC9H_005694 [Pleurotus ostreatus]